MSKFFDLFPKIRYDIQGRRFTNLQLTTDIFFRMRFLKEVLGNISSYYEYIIQEGDTPEILADKIYGDPEAHWIILLANDIVDPQYDWPLVSREFDNYIINKYGSIETAQTTYHHYEKVIHREESASGIAIESRYQINANTYTYGELTLSVVNGDFMPGETITISAGGFSANVYSWDNSTSIITISDEDRTANVLLKFQTIQGGTSNANGIIASIGTDVPFDYYYGLAETQALSTYNLSDGKTIIETIYRDRVTNYDWEVAQNESKREIKIIKPEYYPQIISEFNRLTDYSSTPYMRRFN